GEIARGERLRRRETRAAERRVRDIQEVLGAEAAARARKKSGDPREDRRRGLAVQLLIDDRLRQRTEEGRRAPERDRARTDGVDDPLERRVGGAQVLRRGGGIEPEGSGTGGSRPRAAHLDALDREQAKLGRRPAVGGEP